MRSQAERSPINPMSRSRIAWKLPLWIVVMALSATGVAWAQSGQPGGGRPAQPVVVTNSPADAVPVAVGNLPAVQEVSGTVQVGNLPATQPVSGTVEIGNLPESQVVSGTVDVGNFPAPAPPPLWQGTPYVNWVVLGPDSECGRLAEIPPGTVLFVKRVVASRVENWVNLFFWLPDGTRVVGMPLPISAADDPESFVNDRSGSLEFDVPVTQLEACGDHKRAHVTVFGYLVAA